MLTSALGMERSKWCVDILGRRRKTGRTWAGRLSAVNESILREESI